MRPSQVSLGEHYAHLMHRYPLMLNATQAAIIAALAVVASAKITGQSNIDWLEIKVMMLINFSFITPFMMAAGPYLERVKGGLFPILMVDQITLSPLLTAGIIGLRLFLRGNDIQSIPQEVGVVVPSIMVFSWLFWIPVRAITFVYIPPPMQLLFNNLCAFVWNIIFVRIQA